MTEPASSSRRWKSIRALVVVCGVSALLFAFLLWVTWNPFEHIRSAQPLASRDVGWGPQPYPQHAAGRDELVFLRDSTLEVYRIDASLTCLRVVPFKVEGAELTHLATFPNSPRVIVASVAGNFILSTETGQIERRLTLPENITELIISPDERWLALKVAKWRVEPNSKIQEGWYPVSVIDLQNDARYQLTSPDAPDASLWSMAFVGRNSLFVSCGPPNQCQLWDIPTRQLKHTVRELPSERLPFAVAVSEAVLVTGSHKSCDVWDAGNLIQVRSHSSPGGIRAVTINPKTGDYLAGYSTDSLFRRGLAGAVRIWNANGERVTTFAAHRGSRLSSVTWMAVSPTGEYLVTADYHTIKVWDYATVSGRVK